MSVHMLI